MALFKSQDEKIAEQNQKEFEMLERFGLTGLENPKDIQSVRKIVAELAGTGLMEMGVRLGASEKAALQVQMVYQRAMLEQNFIIIRQLDQLIKMLDK